MKSIAITIFVLLVVAVLAFYLVSFQVRETESAMVTTFGKPARQIVEPGWYFKWPSPIQKIYKFDARMRVYEADLGQTSTKGADPIIVKTYIVWKIAEPLKFFNALGTVSKAETKLYSQISNTQNEVIGQYEFSEFVNSDPEKIKFKQIQEQMLADLRQAVGADYGIEVKTLGIKQLKVSEDVTKQIFDRMKAERERVRDATISQGLAEAIRIKTDADVKQAELLAAAEARAKIIRGQGDAEAAQFYKMFEDDPELAMFLRDIEALKKILQERSTVVFSADSEPFKLLKQVPKLNYKKK
ncbi:protease modulator HflC [Planctomycetota bacterium]